MTYTDNDFRLYHHGVKGQKWGVRRYQNDDGSLTEAGKKRYSVRRTNEIGGRRKERIDKLLGEARSSDLSTDKAKYKMAKKFARELNREDDVRALSYVENYNARTTGQSYANKAKRAILSNQNDKKVDKYIDLAEGLALDSLAYKDALEASVGRMNTLLKEADSLGLKIDYSSGTRLAGGDGYYVTYATKGTFFKAAKPKKESQVQRDKREAKEFDRMEEAENYVSSRYKQLKKTMSADDAREEAAKEARKKYPDVYAPDEEIYPDSHR